jgi:HEAT repeats
MATTLVRVPLLTMPAILLLAAAQRAPAGQDLILWFGAAFQAIISTMALVSPGSWRQSAAPMVVTLYLTALSWLWFGDVVDDWINHFAKAVLVVIPLSAFGYQSLRESGALVLRRANMLAQRLTARPELPSDLAAARNLPEVKALRAALVYDAAPALALLRHPRIEVRLAALAALEFRKEWNPGQAELVLQVAQSAEQPAIRAAAVTALGNVEDRELIEMVASFLHDNSRDVRRAAVEALLWDCEKRWPWIRFHGRRFLADPLFLGDGPMIPDGQLLSVEAVKDLTAWCAEKGTVSAHAATTLAAHYNRLLSERPDASAVAGLRSVLADPHTPAVFRLELGKLLQFHQELDIGLLEKLADPANPGSLRLIACETILAEHSDKPMLRTLAVNALKDLARLSNRELALSTADVVQRRLGVDLGLGLGQPLPPLHSRLATDITRRVMRWANQYDESEELEKSGVPQRR